MTTNGWKRTALKRIEEAIFNLESGMSDSAGYDCPVCHYIEKYQREYNKEKYCWVFWKQKNQCPAIESCDEFSYILNKMKQRPAKIRRLKALKAKLEGAE